MLLTMEYTRDQLILSVSYADTSGNDVYYDYPLDCTITNEMIKWMGCTAWIEPVHLNSYARPDCVTIGGTLVPKYTRFTIKTCECRRKFAPICEQNCETWS